MEKQLQLVLLAALLASAASADAPTWKFTDVTSKVVDKNPPGIGRIFDYAFVDINDDNYLDIAVNNHDHREPAPAWKDRSTTIRVFRNEIYNSRHWLKVQLRQPRKNTVAVGAAVTVFASGTNTILGKRIEQCDTTGYHPRLHFV